MIFDTSSIFRAVEMNHIEKLQGEKTLDLSLYELGNIVWKYVVRNKISLSEGEQLIGILKDVASLMEIVQIGLDMDVYTIAVKNNISYYDASYIQTALSSKESLVSEDKKLLEIASRYNIKAFGMEEL